MMFSEVCLSRTNTLNPAKTGPTFVTLSLQSTYGTLSLSDNQSRWRLNLHALGLGAADLLYMTNIRLSRMSLSRAEKSRLV